MAQEIELKFEVAPEAVERLEQTLIVRPGAKAARRPKTLRSVYYDTPARDLLEAGVTLRVREADGKYVQTVKSAAQSLSARGEWETDLDGDQPDLEAAAGTPLEPILGKVEGPLVPVFGARVERTLHRVREGRANIEAALDRGQIEADGRSEPVCELELELKAGDRAALFALARRLAEAVPVRLSFVTKAERGYRLLEGRLAGEAVKQGKVKLQRGMTVRQAFQAIATDALRQWVANAAVLRAARRPEALHQMRVALRRMRTALTLFKAAVADDAFPALNAELKWLAGELDLGRDTDVIIAESFRPAAGRFHSQTGMAPLGERLLKARTRAYDRALQMLDEPRYLRLVLDMAAFIDSGRWADPALGPGADRPIEVLAAEGLDKLRRQLKRRGRGLERLGAAERHKLRIRAKRMRYALEFFSGLYGRRRRRCEAFLKPLKALQSDLGALNDMVVALDKGLALAESGGRAAGDSEAEGMQQAFAAGLMIGARAVAEAELLARAADNYAALMDAEPFWR